MEYNDIYDEHRQRTGRTHLRGTPWIPGEYALVVCVWVYDGAGRILLTRRAPEKSYPGTWENSGGMARAGESSRDAIVRELYEETGITAAPEEPQLLASNRDDHYFYDHYCLCRRLPLSAIRLLPGETDDARWVTHAKIHEMIQTGAMCRVIAAQFLRLEPQLLARQTLNINARRNETYDYPRKEDL